jgi:hypothetical protein
MKYINKIILSILISIPLFSSYSHSNTDSIENIIIEIVNIEVKPIKVEITSLKEQQVLFNKKIIAFNDIQINTNKQSSDELKRIVDLEKYIIKLEEKIKINGQILPIWMLELKNDFVQWNNQTFSLPKNGE